jgi:hypothetical protein
MSDSRPNARPLSACTSAGMRPFTSPRPVGHILRGSTSTPGRPSAAEAAPSASALTSVGSDRLVQRSQRPHGDAAPATTSGSSSWRRRNSIRQSGVAA